MQPIAIQIRRDTEARWLGTGTILRPGEQSYSTDTNVIKVGDGVSTWSALPPIGAGGGGSSTSPLMTDNFMVAGGYRGAPGTALSYSYDGLTWVSSGTNIFGSALCNGVAWNGSIWLALGYNGTNGLIASSPDGIRWTVELSGTGTPFSDGRVEAAAWNGSLWVAVGVSGGASGAIATSPDGKTWTARTSPFTVSAFAVASNGNMFVAGGATSNSKLIAYSYDGIKWVNAPTGSIFGTGLNIGSVTCVACNGKLWVAGGKDDLQNIVIATSPDGINWTQRTPPFPVLPAAGFLSSVAWNGSLWMACGRNGSVGGFALTSPDGTNWTDITANLSTDPFTYIYTVSWNGARWFLGGTGVITTSLLRTSADTITWTTQTTGIGNTIFTTASRRVLPYVGESPVAPAGPALSLSYYLSGNTGANTGLNAISVIGFNTSDPSNSVTGGALDINYSTGDGVLTNTSSKTISVLVSGQVTTDNTAFDLARIQPCLYVTKNSDNIVSSSVINFNGSSFSTIVVLAPAETISIRYTQTSPYDPIIDVSGVQFIGGQFSTRITFTQMEFSQGPCSGGEDSFSGVVRSSLIPDTAKTYDLGSTGFPFRSLYVTGTTIYLGQGAIKEEGGTIQLVSSSGNASAGPTGPTGSTIPATSIIYGDGTPSSGTGQLDDTYIQRDTAIMYRKENIVTPPTWEELPIAGERIWTFIVSSNSGQYVFAIDNTNGNDSVIYTNSNYGSGEWNIETIENAPRLVSIASDSTGQYLAAVATDVNSGVGLIYTNDNYGVSADWSANGAAGMQPWTSITSSSDGTYLTAVSSNGIIVTTTDRGTSWTTTTTNYGATFADSATTVGGDSVVVSANGFIYYKQSLTNPSVSPTWTRIGDLNATPLPTYRTAKIYDTGGATPLIIATLDGMNTIQYATDITGFTPIGDEHIWTSVVATDAVNIDFFAVYSDGAGGIIQNTDLSGVLPITNPPDSQGIFVSVAAVKESGTDTYSFVVADQGQYIHTCDYIAHTESFTWKKGDKTATWTSLAMVSDYMSEPSPIILAAARDISGGIYISDNSGETFTKITTTSTSNQFTSVSVCGSLGTYGAAAVGLNDYVYVSTDGNLATWTAKELKRDFFSISCLGDKDAMSLLATDSSGNVWYSEDSGDTWDTKTPAPSFSSVTSSADGDRVIAAADSDGYIWLYNTDTDTWSPNYNSGVKNWVGISFRDDADPKLTAIEGNGAVFNTSDMGGTPWEDIWAVSSEAYGPRTWTSLKWSNSFELVLTENTNGGEGYIWVYTTKTSSFIIQSVPDINSWTCATISSDGTRIIAGYSSLNQVGKLWRLLPEEYAPQWVSKIDVGAVATYQTIDSDYWSNIGPPVTIKDAIDRIGLALYNASPNPSTPL
jgi:hypothetical protein